MDTFKFSVSYLENGKFMGKCPRTDKSDQQRWILFKFKLLILNLEF